MTSRYEKILMTQLRNVSCTTEKFRELSRKLGGFLVSKVIDCLEVIPIEVQTPVGVYQGLEIEEALHLVSVMRAGDALVESFLTHFQKASVSKILIQRDEETAIPHFKYMKLSSTIASGFAVVIIEPMVATGGTLAMVIRLLKEKGVLEEKIIIASICAAPEGLVYLQKIYPKVRVVTTELDEKLNDKKYIVPGLGDFGDRYFGTYR